MTPEPTPDAVTPWQRGLHFFGLGAAACAGILLVSGCATSGGAGGSAPEASALLAPTANQTASGVAWLSQDGPASKDRVVLRVRVSGLTPNQEHGFHIHETGDCSAPDASSAGGHWNPYSMPHGPQHGKHHAGDLPALKADAQGVADANFEVYGTVKGTGGLLGKAIVVHAAPDDYATQPTGNSGARIACGVITSPAVPADTTGPAPKAR